MKELLVVIAKALVEHPEDVRVQEIEKDDALVYELFVHSADVGKIIGKHGRIAKAIRTVMTSASVKEGKRIMVEIVS